MDGSLREAPHVSFLVPNLRVGLTLVPGGGERPAVIDGMVPGEALRLTAVSRRDADATVRLGDRITARFGRVNDASYYFDGEVLEMRRGLRLGLVLRWPEAVERRQNRRHVRMVARFDVYVGRPDDPSSWERARSVDVSGGGIGIVGLAALRAGDEVRVRCSLPRARGLCTIDTLARVVRCEPASETSRGGVLMWRSGLEFVRMPIRRQDELMATVMWNLARRRVVV